jgi:dTDP-4-dehydrorhamnose 3,5-epimerase-like enzyme
MKIEQIVGGKAVDERGSVSFVNDFNFENVKRFYQISNHSQGFVRAWHGHMHEAKYVYVNAGVFKIGVIKLQKCDSHESGYNFDMTSGISKYIITADQPRFLYIPAGYANGFMNLTSDNIITFYSTSTLEESKNDDYRYRYDHMNSEWFWKSTFC